MARTAGPALILLCAALALGACGRKGALEPPGGTPAATDEKKDQAPAELPHKP